ncbi:MAG TPA: UDP-2,3-diacylglucosamine diphosphatase [Xanthomonadaceae bacterium]|jgi:UDP-2,3-diacylglucosamine pyrophosphatase LpxH
MRTRQFRTVFISDVHLGTPTCRSAYLLDFLRSTDCEQLYLVGDILDLEALARRSYWHPQHTAIIAEIFRKADAGTRVTYIPGNHDAAMRSRAGQAIGRVRVMLDAVHETADGRRFRVSHGDEHDPHDYGKRWLYWVGERAQRLVIFSGRGLNAVRRRLRKPYVPVSIWVKQRIGRALRYIRAYEHRVAEAAHVRGFDGHVCGHIHCGTIRDIDGVTYCNDGDWVEHCTALTEDFDGGLSLIQWTERCTLLAVSPARVAVVEEALRPAA